MDMMIEKAKEIQISCPICGKEKNYGYDATGKSSSRCAKCKRLILWDYDKKIAIPMKAIMKKDM